MEFLPEKILVDWTTLRSSRSNVITNVFPAWIPHLILSIKSIMCCRRMKQFPVFLCGTFPPPVSTLITGGTFFDHFKNKLDRPPWGLSAQNNNENSPGQGCIDIYNWPHGCNFFKVQNSPGTSFLTCAPASL